MTDLDALKRTIADLEKRVSRLEREREQSDGMFVWEPSTSQSVKLSDIVDYVSAEVRKQFCECGRDVCRAPDCPSHMRSA